MILIKVNNTLYSAIIVEGKECDREWDGRKSKAITIEGDFSFINSLFCNDIKWSIVCEDQVPVLDNDGNPIVHENGDPVLEAAEIEYDNSEYCIRGDLIVHTDGTITVKMGKKTDEEELQETADMLLLEILGV